MILRMLVSVALAGGLLWSASPDLMDGNFQIERPSQQISSNVQAQRLAPRESAPIQDAAPFWKVLENLNPEDRANALISLELPARVSDEVQTLAHEVESLWNAGHYEAALQRARDLARHLDPTHIAVGIQWREPRRISYRWGNDVVIAEKNNVQSVRLAHHEGTGHLFALVTYQDTTSTEDYLWALNISTDGGATWAETYIWSYMRQGAPTGLATMGDYVYIAYGRPASGPTAARLRRADAATGSIDAAFSWHEVFDFGVDINEIELLNNASYDNRLYYTALLDNNEIVFFWIEEDGVSYHQIPTGVTNASRGLSGTWNDGYTPELEQGLFFSYINTNDSVHVLLVKNDGTFEDLGNIDFSGESDFYNLYTDIAAHRDTVIVAFEHTTPGAVVHWVKYRINYGNLPDGAWYWGYLAPDTTTTSFCPALTGAHNDGFGAVIYYAGDIVYTHRAYSPPTWTDPEVLSDGSASNTIKPDISWISPGVYGVAYVDPLQSQVFFDRSDWTDVAEGSGSAPAGALTLRALPTHHGARLVLQMPQAGPARLQVFNVAGARIQEIPLNLATGTHEVRVSVPTAGVYLARLVTTEGAATARFVVLP